MKKNVKMILLSLFISFAAIGTANAANHCGTYLHGKWGASSAIYVLKKDLEAKKMLLENVLIFLIMMGKRYL